MEKFKDGQSTEQDAADFQRRVDRWMMACFGPETAADKLERGDRLLEEVLELLQSGGFDPARVAALRDYVWGRPVGEPSQEVGGVMVTLAAYCSSHGLDMDQAAETELSRVWGKVEQIRAKQAAKPTGSALPIAMDDQPVGASEAAAELERLREVNEQLLAALRFYANEDNWISHYQGDQAEPSAIDQDNEGNLARATVAKAEGVIPGRSARDS